MFKMVDERKTTCLCCVYISQAHSLFYKKKKNTELVLLVLNNTPFSLIKLCTCCILTIFNLQYLEVSLQCSFLQSFHKGYYC